VTHLAITSQHLATHRAEVELVGELDIETAPQLRGTVAHLIAAGYVHLAINLHGLDFLDSTGLGVLVTTLKKLRAQGGSLSLSCSNPQILRTFRTTALDKVFDISCPTDASKPQTPRRRTASPSTTGAAPDLGSPEHQTPA
jgi:anti-sigma B factor antagonist